MSKVKHLSLWLLSCFLLSTSSLSLGQTAKQLADADKPVYMLTYDHGGLILWGSDHFNERMENAISWLDKYPSFKIGLENEAQIYDYFAENEPEILQRINNYLNSYPDRFGIGSCTYGQPLSTFINEESNIRQISYALDATKKHFNYRPPVYIMSEHAMHSQIPQIITGFGFEGAIMRTHYMMYGYNPTFNVPIGLWKGVDGSKIPTIPTYVGEGAAFGKTTIDTWILTRYPSKDCSTSMEDYRAQFKHINPLLATRADDSGLRKEALVAQYEGNPKFQWILLDELLGKYPTAKDVLPTGPNDFTVRMPWGYCGNEIWNMSRSAEVEVLTAERLAALELLNGGMNREKDLKGAWKKLLLAQHHDIQIVGLLPEARKLLPASIELSKKVKNNSLQYFAENMTCEGIKQVTVFNPNSWPQSKWITASVSLSKGEAMGFEVKGDGRALQTRLLSADKYSDKSILDGVIAFKAELPPLSVMSYSIIPLKEAKASEPSKIQIDNENLIIKTLHLEIKLAEKGGIEYLKNNLTGKLITDDKNRNAYFEGLINGEASISSGRWIIKKSDEHTPWTVATEYGFVSDIPYQFEIKVYEDSPIIECKVNFDFNGQKIGLLSDNERDSHSPFVHEEKLRFKLFPAMDEKTTGIRDLPFVIKETDNIYVEGNYWTAVSDGSKGIAMFNKGTMGMIREEDGSISMPLAYAMYYIWGTRMLNGNYAYEFAIMPFDGPWKDADIHRNALSYNYPIVSLESKPGKGKLSDHVDLINATSDEVILSALYAESGKIYARFYECAGMKSTSPVSSFKDGLHIMEVGLDGTVNNEASSSINPWQILTFQLK